MKVSSLLAVLGDFESAVATALGSEPPASFTEFRHLFAGHEAENVAPFVNKLIKQRDIHGRDTCAVPIASLCQTLTKLESCLRSAEAKKAADDVAKLVELLEGCGQPSIGELVSDARKWLMETSQPKSKIKSSPV